MTRPLATGVVPHWLIELPDSVMRTELERRYFLHKRDRTMARLYFRGSDALKVFRQA